MAKNKNNPREQELTPKRLTITSQFKKDLKAYRNDEDVQNRLKVVSERLMKGERLDKYPEYRDHILAKGQWRGLNDCHLKPDLILLYRRTNGDEIILERIGHHSKIGLNSN